MGWATGYIAQLKTGETASFCPRGKIEPDQFCTVAPLSRRKSAGAAHAAADL